MYWRNRLVIACAFALVFSSSALAQRPRPPKIDVPADEAYVHEPSGAVFPAKIQNLGRIEVVRYDDTGENISAGYQQRQPQFRVTVYVYPTLGEELDEHFDRVRDEIEQVHKGVKLIEQRPWKLKQDGVERAGRRAKFSITGFAGTDGEMTSELYLLQIGDWFMKYRVSYPSTSSPAAPKVIAGLHEGVKVPKE